MLPNGLSQKFEKSAIRISMHDPYQFSLFGEEKKFDGIPKRESSRNSLRQTDAVTPSRREIPYRLKRVRRRSVGLRIGVNGLEVSAPRWVSVVEIERIIEEKRQWIEKKLSEREAWRRNAEIDKIRFETGGLIPYRGQRIKIVVGSAAKTELLSDGKTLAVALPQDAESSRVRESVRAWLTKEAERVIGERLKLFSSKTGLIPARWRLSSAHGRWGSCSADRVIRFSWRLIFFEDDVIDYVVAHELTHLKHMDHSERFWKSLEKIFPGYVQSRSKLMGIPAGELVF